MDLRRVWHNETIDTYFCSTSQPAPNVTDWIDVSRDKDHLVLAEKKFREDLNFHNASLCRAYLKLALELR